MIARVLPVPAPASTQSGPAQRGGDLALLGVERVEAGGVGLVRRPPRSAAPSCAAPRHRHAGRRPGSGRARRTWRPGRRSRPGDGAECPGPTTADERSCPSSPARSRCTAPSGAATAAGSRASWSARASATPRSTSRSDPDAAELVDVGQRRQPDGADGASSPTARALTNPSLAQVQATGSPPEPRLSPGRAAARRTSARSAAARSRPRGESSTSPDVDRGRAARARVNQRASAISPSSHVDLGRLSAVRREAEHQAATGTATAGCRGSRPSPTATPTSSRHLAAHRRARATPPARRSRPASRSGPPASCDWRPEQQPVVARRPPP